MNCCPTAGLRSSDNPDLIHVTIKVPGFRDQRVHTELTEINQIRLCVCDLPAWLAKPMVLKKDQSNKQMTTRIACWQGNRISVG